MQGRVLKFRVVFGEFLRKPSRKKVKYWRDSSYFPHMISSRSLLSYRENVCSHAFAWWLEITNKQTQFHNFAQVFATIALNDLLPISHICRALSRVHIAVKYIFNCYFFYWYHTESRDIYLLDTRRLCRCSMSLLELSSIDRNGWVTFPRYDRIVPFFLVTHHSYVVAVSVVGTTILHVDNELWSFTERGKELLRRSWAAQSPTQLKFNHNINSVAKHVDESQFVCDVFNYITHLHETWWSIWWDREVFHAIFVFRKHPRTTTWKIRLSGGVKSRIFIQT